MADTIADLVAHLGLDVDKGSFEKANEALNQLANEMAKTVKDAAGNMTAALVAMKGEATRNTLKAVEVIGIQLPDALKKAGHAAEHTGHKFGWLHHVIGIGAALHFGHVIEGWAHHAIKAGAAVGDLADKTGASVEEIQELGYAANIHGMSTQFMANTLGKLAVNLDKAAKKGGEAAEPFKKAGIAIKDAEGKARPAADVMADVADRLKDLSEEERPAEAVKLLGKAGKELIPLLKGGSKGLEDFRKEARELGLVMSETTVESMDKVEKNTKRLGKAWEGIKEHAVAALIPEIEKLTTSLLKWYEANKEDVAHVIHEVFHLILVVVKLLSKAFMILIKITAALLKSWKALTVVIVALGAAYLILNRHAITAGWTMFKAGLKAAAGWIIAAAPLIALTALIAGIILAVQDFYVWMKGGKSVMGDMFGKFEDNEWAKGIAKVFEYVAGIVKWLVDKISWAVGKAEHLYRGIFKKDEVDKEQKNAGVAIKSAAEIEQLSASRSEILERIRNNSGFGGAGLAAVQAVSVGSRLNAAVDRQEAARAELSITNNITIHDGNPDKYKAAAEEVNAKSMRQLEATVGGGKRK
jgi:hypothetical protein